MPTLVSAYYNIPSKASHDKYFIWLKRFLQNVSAPLVFFTSKDIEEQIHAWGIQLNTIKVVPLEFKDLRAWNKGESFWRRQKERDPEIYHTVELGVIWYEKKEFVERAMKLCPDEEVFIWCDAGCIRDDYHEAAVRGFGTRNVPLNDNKMHLEQIYKKPAKQDFYSKKDVYIAGGFQAGNRKAWGQHSALYDLVLHEYDMNGFPAVSDQFTLMKCVDKIPELYELHCVPATYRNNEWFWILTYL